MLQNLPSEIIYHIVSCVPTANCVTHLAQTCKRLYRVISADDYRIFRAFVQSGFPSIDTPPFWRDATRALTSRSRAFDLNGIIGRFVLPPDITKRIGQRQTVRVDDPTLGYRPVIDSYEQWYGDSWFSRKEVLIWGAGADLVIRITDFGLRRVENGLVARSLDEQNNSHHSDVNKQDHRDDVRWTIFNDLKTVDSWDDISGAHLLPAATTGGGNSGVEDIIFGRRSGKLIRMSISPDGGWRKITKSYLTGDRTLERTDISRGPQSVLTASLDNHLIAFYMVETDGSEVRPFANLDTTSHGPSRTRYSKLLCDDRLALGSDGTGDKIAVFDITPDGIRKSRELSFDNSGNLLRKMRVSAIEPLPVTSQIGWKPGDLFLAGWYDSRVRLLDLRRHDPTVSTFVDTVDDSPIYSIQAMGHEQFIVGSGVNAIVKIYDMRMPGRYSYMDAIQHEPQQQNINRNGASRTKNRLTPEFTTNSSLGTPTRRRDISLFLSHRNPSHRGRTPLLRHSRQYNGPVYAISHPSPTSSSFYVGVEDSLIRLDFASSDDLVGPHGDWHFRNLDLEWCSDLNGFPEIPSQPLTLSCYERPLPEDCGRGVRLMMQDPFWPVLRNQTNREDEWIPGWDKRWFQPWVTKNQKWKGPWRRDI